MISRRKLAEHAAERLVKGDSTASVLNELAAYLLDARRTGEAELVIRAVEDSLLSRGVALATVTSARTLTTDAKDAVEQLIRREYSDVKSVLLREIIDPSVLAGMKVSLAGAQLDVTAKTKLEKLGV
ncbi:MAG TPA: F0F1 ATP synthase subunit delta [Candidatus Saccharibacteria bacterium]|nr:F0F1 ATP synthase subunit delta [Candidatus Saccharibacteria bacterium]